VKELNGPAYVLMCQIMMKAGAQTVDPQSTGENHSDQLQPEVPRAQEVPENQSKRKMERLWTG
jgi:hypothetical protein